MKRLLKILIVEDIPTDAELVLYEIKKSGIEFTRQIVETKMDYISGIKEFKPDVILSDYSLPHFDGGQALMIRQELAPSIPFILVTGSINRETAVELMKAGADDYVIKEHISRIGSAIKTALEKKEILSAKNKAEEELKILSRAIEQNPVSIIITNLEGEIKYANPKFTELTGYYPEELLGKNPNILKSGFTSDKEYEELWSTIKQGKEWRGEFRNKKKNGEIYFESALISPILDEKGKILHFLSLKEDVTEKKKMLSDLIAAKEALILAKEKAEESDRLKTAFLHNISHEIRTPMNAIIGFSEFLNEPKLSPEKRQFFTNIIIQSSNQLLSIITDIINIATIEAGQEKIDIKEVNIQSICKLIHEQFINNANQQQVTLSYSAASPGNEPIIFTDETKLIQILTNLVGNALKFTKKGHVHFGYTIKENEIEFFTEDTGIGISPDMHEEIFKRFRQVEFAATRQFGGSGLGLSISKAYVELLGGKIWLTSKPGVGSSFYFNIPLNKNQVPQDNQLTKEFPIQLKSPVQLLIAEDEDSNFLLLEEILADADIQIFRALNGLQAVEMCKTRQVDLVLMDIKMPVLDGCEATRQIKKIKPGLFVIAQTAYTMPEEKERALQAGCDDYITKPIKSGDLMALIKKYSSILLLLFALPFLSWSQTEFEVVFDDDPAPITRDSVNTIVLTDSLRCGLVSNARKYIGTDYHYSQSNENGFDCSGYVKYVYGNFGYSLPRSSYDQYKQSRHLKAAEAQPGDLVFFITRGKKVSHVGIYLGNSEFIHSPSKGKSVSISNLNEIYYKKHMAGFGSYLISSSIQK